MERTLHKGDIVRHFKRETVDPDSTMYLYEIKGIAIHSETKEEMMLYQGLYGDFLLYVRPLKMFMSEVYHEKYPAILQKYLFEKTTLTPQEKENIQKQKEALHLD